MFPSLIREFPRDLGVVSGEHGVWEREGAQLVYNVALRLTFLLDSVVYIVSAFLP